MIHDRHKLILRAEPYLQKKQLRKSYEARMLPRIAVSQAERQFARLGVIICSPYATSKPFFNIFLIVLI